MGIASELGNWIRETVKERLNIRTIGLEAFETLTDRTIPQGAAEFAQALYVGNAYVPYGPGQEPLPVEPSDLGQLSPGPMPSIQDMYDEQLAMYSARGRDDDKGLSR